MRRKAFSMRRSVVRWLGLALGLLAAACGGGDRTAPAERTQSAAPAPAEVPAEAEFRLVMLGDSITAGYGLPAGEALPDKLQAALRANGAKVTIVNAGVSGDTTADALARFDWVLAGEADGVFIALGGNDLLQGVDPEITEENLRAIIGKAKTRGLAVMLAGMRAPGNYGEDFRSAFDAIYPRLAREEGVALYPFLLDGVGGEAGLNQRDGIHPNPQGVAAIVEKLAPFIAGAIAADS
jgi:acyl-CoA thioesterase-1